LDGSGRVHLDEMVFSESRGWEKKKKHVGKFFFGPFSFHLVPGGQKLVKISYYILLISL
jgi:hypothetical protein